MNKLYEIANIVSVFFFMPVLIFMAYTERTTSSENKPAPVVTAQPPALQAQPAPELKEKEPSPKPDRNRLLQRPLIPNPLIPRQPQQPQDIENQGNGGIYYYYPQQQLPYYQCPQYIPYTCP